MSIASAVLDFYDDSHHELMSKVAMPAAVRDAPFTPLSPEEHDELSEADFGLVVLTKTGSVHRKFPVNDPGNAWLSAQYFSQTHKKLAFPARYIAASHIKEACDAYSVPTSKAVDAYAAQAEDVPGNMFVEGSEARWMQEKLAQHELMSKQATAAEFDARVNLPDENFALVYENEDGETIRKYAMPDVQRVEKAAAYFEKYAMQFQPGRRHQFASSVKNRANELGVDLSNYNAIHKWAGDNWNRSVIAHIEQRRSLLPRNEDAQDVLSKLAASIGETSPSDMAQALSTFDKATGLTRYYDRDLADPYASTMSKVATSWSAEVGDETLTESDLRKVAQSAKLAGYLGDSFASKFKESPVEIFESLPDPEKSLIKQIAFGEA